MKSKLLLTALVTFLMVGGASAHTDHEITQYKDPTLSVNNLTGQITTTVYLKNTNGEMPERYLVEMQVRDRNFDFLSFVSNKQTCDPKSPENVHKDFVLEPGEKEAITLTSTVPNSSVYDVALFTGTGCMVGPTEEADAHLIQPYSGYPDDYPRWDNVAVNKTVPTIPQNLKLLGAGLLVLLAGYFGYREVSG